LTSRVEGFLTAWLVRRNVEEAAGYLSSEANACAVDGDSEGQAQVRAAMQRVADEVGSVKALDMAIVPPAANHPDIQIVRHPSDKKYALVAIPEYMGDALECAKRRRGESAALPQQTGAKNYGKYYAMGLKLRKTGEDSGVLWAVWTREKDVWKLSSYTVLTP
jgi:hypothetical protein